MTHATHNGNQERVREAVRRGYGTWQAIAAYTGLGPWQVQNALRRLMDNRQIERAPGRGYRTRHNGKALAEVWGVRA